VSWCVSDPFLSYPSRADTSTASRPSQLPSVHRLTVDAVMMDIKRQGVSPARGTWRDETGKRDGQPEDVVEDPVGRSLLDELEHLRELERGRVVDDELSGDEHEEVLLSGLGRLSVGRVDLVLHLAERQALSQGWIA
jgi:hypothetical protein